MIRPAPLKEGDTLGIIAPASPPDRAEDLQRGKKTLERMGFRVMLGKFLSRNNRYLAGKDEERAEDLNRMFADPRVAGIVCLRGGYGAGRILHLIDYWRIQKSPKVFMGHSDITALHLAIQKKTGLVTFYGPMVATEMARRFSEYTREQMIKATVSLEPVGAIGSGPKGAKVHVIKEGIASGPLVGGYLPCIVASLGTEFEIDSQGKILFFEDVRKEPFEIDRMLTQLLLAGKLQAAAGIAIGQCVDCEPKGRFPSSFSLKDVFRDRLAGIGIPVLAGLCFGHGAHKATLPIGVKAVLDTKKKVLNIVQPAVERPGVSPLSPRGFPLTPGIGIP